MNTSHEDYIHLLVCIDRLNSSWKTLKEIEKNPKNPLAGPAFRYALIEYCIPFTRSEGHTNRNRRLSEDLVPEKYNALHARILSARHSIHAHADLKPLDSELYFEEIDGEKYVGLVQNIIPGLSELSNLSEIIDLVQGVLDNAYEMHKKIENIIEP